MHTYSPGQYEMARCDSVHMEYIFGEWRQIKDFSYYLAFDTTETTGLMRYYSTLAEGLGMIYNGGTSDAGWIHYLKGAVIDGILYGDTTYVSIDDGKIQESTPDNFELFQNYPNPFNSSTCFKLMLYEKSITTLIIYNVNGKEVVRLLDKQLLNSGEQYIHWDAKGKEGENLSSGIYFYHVRVGNISKTGRLLIIR